MLRGPFIEEMVCFGDLSVSLFFLCLWFCLGGFFLSFLFCIFVCLWVLFVLWRKTEFSVPGTPCADPM